MISMKAAVAVALSGLGAASMANVAYLEFGKRTPVAAPKPATPVSRQVIPHPEAPPAAPVNRIVELKPVFVYSRATSHIVKRPNPEKGLVACKEWRPLESGPEGHGVRALCPP